jgi:hypothetical protein
MRQGNGAGLDRHPGRAFRGREFRRRRNARKGEYAQAHIATSMNWSRTLAKPIIPRDGRRVGTVAAALALVLSLPDLDRRQAIWRDLGELLGEAAND